MRPMRAAFVALSLSAAFAASAVAQIKPERTYYGINRPLPVKVSGKGKLLLRAFSQGKEAGRAEVKSGTVDLAKAFAGIWSEKPTGPVHVQTYSGEKAIGPALVLVPMTNPAVSTMDADAAKPPKFSPDEDQAFAGYRAYVDKRVVFETSMGEMEFRMRPDAAPNTVANLLQLVEGGFYDGVIIHRVVAKGRDGNPFVIQGGDPTGTGSGGPGYAIPLEDSSLGHDFGVISMARSSDPNTAGSQWFVALSRAGTARLDHRYASFGELVRGADVLRKIAAVEVGEQDRPKSPPVLKRARLIDAPPYPVELATEVPKGQ